LLICYWTDQELSDKSKASVSAISKRVSALNPQDDKWKMSNDKWKISYIQIESADSTVYYPTLGVRMDKTLQEATQWDGMATI
jgi:hypothetical protein